MNVEGGLAVGLVSLQVRSAADAAPQIASRWGIPVRSLRNGSR